MIFTSDVTRFAERDNKLTMSILAALDTSSTLIKFSNFVAGNGFELLSLGVSFSLDVVALDFASFSMLHIAIFKFCIEKPDAPLDTEPKEATLVLNDAELFKLKLDPLPLVDD